MDDDKKKLIYGKWRALVRTMKLTVKGKNDEAYICEEWCPKNPSADDISEYRPQLREIFLQAMEGTLVKEGHPGKIVKLSEFKDLMQTTHGGSNPVREAELISWSVIEIDEATRSMWKGVDAKSKRYLRHCMGNYLLFEKKMDDLDRRMERWMKSANLRLKKFITLRDKPGLPIKPRHHKTIELGEARLSEVEVIRDKIPLEIQYFKEKFQVAMLDVLFNSANISEVPKWSEEMALIQKRNESVIPDSLTLEVDDPRDDDKDGPLEALAAHYEEMKNYHENMMIKEEVYWDKVRKM